MQHLWNSSVDSSRLPTLESGFSAVPHGGNAAVHSLPFSFRVREKYSVLAIELLLDFCGARAFPEAHPLEHPQAHCCALVHQTLPAHCTYGQSDFLGKL